MKESTSFQAVILLTFSRNSYHPNSFDYRGAGVVCLSIAAHNTNNVLFVILRSVLLSNKLRKVARLAGILTGASLNLFHHDETEFGVTCANRIFDIASRCDLNQLINHGNFYQSETHPAGKKIGIAAVPGGEGREIKTLYWIVSRHLKVSGHRCPCTYDFPERRRIFFLLFCRTEARPCCFCNLARYPTDIIKQDKEELEDT